MVYVNIQGLNMLDPIFRTLCDKDTYNKIMMELAINTLAKATELAPEDTGLMESSIQIIETNGKWGLVIDGTLVPYAVYNEFGTYKMPVGDEINPLPITSTSGKAAYRPFLRPAAYRCLDDLDSIVNKIMFGKLK